MTSEAAPSAVSYINEFPHPAFVVHYHPGTGQFRLGYVADALGKQVSAIELDLQYRSSDNQVVCNHDCATAESPTLKEVFDYVLAYKAESPTLYNKGCQFFLVMEPKQAWNDLLDGLRKLLVEYSHHWSTAVGAGGEPRGLTVVITGDHSDQFYECLPTDEKSSVCIVEGRNYPDVVNLSKSSDPFKWRNFENESAKGQVDKAHDAGFSTRIWGASDLKLAFSAGSDSVNCDLGRIEECKAMLLNQDPRGYYPSLAVHGSKIMLAWRGRNSNNLYTSLGTVGADGPEFTRQVLMTWLLRQKPQACAPSLTFDQEGKVLIVYQGTAESRLWYVGGEFTSYDRYLAFTGDEHRLTAEDNSRRGTNPSVALAPDDGRVVIVYTGTAESRLWYVTGKLDCGILKGEEHRLTTEDNARRGTNPSVAISADGQVIVIYEGTRDHAIWYVTGKLNTRGQIVGKEHRFTWGPGFTPCAVFDRDGRVLVVYRSDIGGRLSYVYGTIGGDGAIDGRQFSLTTPDNARRGYTPTAAFDDSGKVTIMYRGTAEQKLWYAYGSMSPETGFSGREKRLNMSFDRWGEKPA